MYIDSDAFNYRKEEKQPTDPPHELNIEVRAKTEVF
jgi:hypothetical protein